MTTIYNSELSKELQEAAKIQVSRDSVPNQIADKVVPTVETNPKFFRRIEIVRSTSSVATAAVASTIYAVGADENFFLCAVRAAVIKDATCDVATGRFTINATVGGVAREIFAMPLITLTAQQINENIVFPNPIKVDRGTNITFGIFSYAAGVSSRCATIFGYNTPNPKA